MALRVQTAVDRLFLNDAGGSLTPTVLRRITLEPLKSSPEGLGCGMDVTVRTPTLYLDTSVLGGYFDDVWKQPTQELSS